jgi:hypothetical protein
MGKIEETAEGEIRRGWARRGTGRGGDAEKQK